ncbi:methyltransferase domain-containing protein [uncultured Desulfuromusa sp.]|uniref:class I SAM-dependent methyltransferase n=1 Tax=uncultured Desulfuromusa sp. TaxID=219183 RepID=UPI002AA6B94D|nr:methyltransferase domain-containing protein [uncultured Desulfuromusa sp.]
MTHLRKGRRKYYDFFSHIYDAFIRMHSRQDEDDTRKFLVDAAHLEDQPAPRILDLCCGTGSVVLAFESCYPESVAIGYDFSHGMLGKAQEKNVTGRVIFVEGDAALLPFADDSFDVVTCSHALYELKGGTRQKALREMKRVIRPDGYVLLMEHEIPQRPVVKLLFYIRLLSMGSKDAREFVKGGAESLKQIFAHVTLSHSQTGKSKLMSCQK